MAKHGQKKQVSEPVPIATAPEPKSKLDEIIQSGQAPGVVVKASRQDSGSISGLPASMIKEYVPGYKEPDPNEDIGELLPGQPAESKTKVRLKKGQWWKVKAVTSLKK